jgi:hypothetical protein
MTVVRFRVRLEDEADADEVAALLEHRLGRLAAVEEVQAEVAQPQAIGEVVIVVAGAVAITPDRRGAERSREGWRDLKRTLSVELDGAHVDVRDVGDDELERLAADST